VKAFAPHGLRQDHKARLSAWHVAYRFTRRTERTSLQSGRSALPAPE
jgi:hypothetical protein